MKLDENYHIEIDSNNWVLCFEKSHFNEKEKKTVVSKDRWYYGNLEGCLRRYINESPKGIPTVAALLTKLDELEDIIKSIKR